MANSALARALCCHKAINSTVGSEGAKNWRSRPSRAIGATWASNGTAVALAVAVHPCTAVLASLCFCISSAPTTAAICSAAIASLAGCNAPVLSVRTVEAFVHTHCTKAKKIPHFVAGTRSLACHKKDEYNQQGSQGPLHNGRQETGRGERLSCWRGRRRRRRPAAGEPNMNTPKSEHYRDFAMASRLPGCI